MHLISDNMIGNIGIALQVGDLGREQAESYSRLQMKLNCSFTDWEPAYFFMRGLERDNFMGSSVVRDDVLA